MSKIFLANAFSLQMIKEFPVNITISEIKEEEFNQIKKEAKSYIGHQDLANILGVEYNRENLTLNKGIDLVVAQVTGGRLPEGTTVLPEGVKIKYLLVKII